MTFAWQGFRLKHPEDWGPASLTGSHAAGYARLTSSGDQSIQIRWQGGKPRDLNLILAHYFRSLEREAKRARKVLKTLVDEEPGRLSYRWSAEAYGRGFVLERSGRVFIVEAIGSRPGPVQNCIRQVAAGFSPEEDQEMWLWSVLGLSVLLPRTFALSRHDLQAGKTTLHFERGRTTLECTRWGFAEQLLKQHALEAWSKSALNMESAQCLAEHAGFRLIHRSLAKQSSAIVAVQPDRNQLVSIKLTQFRGKEEPAWDWIAGPTT